MQGLFLLFTEQAGGRQPSTRATNPGHGREVFASQLATAREKSALPFAGQMAERQTGLDAASPVTEERKPESDKMPSSAGEAEILTLAASEAANLLGIPANGPAPSPGQGVSPEDRIASVDRILRSIILRQETTRPGNTRPLPESQSAALAQEGQAPPQSSASPNSTARILPDSAVIPAKEAESPIELSVSGLRFKEETQVREMPGPRTATPLLSAEEMAAPGKRPPQEAGSPSFNIQAVADDEAEADSAAPRSASLETGGQRQDMGSRYIHAHLPNRVNGLAAERNNTRQGEREQGHEGARISSYIPEGKGQNPTSLTVPGADPAAQTMPGANSAASDAPPLIFAHQKDGNTAPLQSGETAQSMRLPSGAQVPDTAVIDQMITRFAMNRRLESGVINLRLQPQELGKLQMEIRVEHETITARIVAQHAHSLEMIDRHLPRLREALEQQGLHLQEVEVTLAAPDSNAEGRFQEHTAQQQGPRGSARPGFGSPVFSLDDTDAPTETGQAAGGLHVRI